MKTQFRILWLVPCLIALTSAQKPKSLKPARQATSQSFGQTSNNNNHDDGSYRPSQQQHIPQYTQPQQYQPAQHQPFRAYSPGSLAEKPVYSQILQDNRQLNHDGTINFSYAADNGLQQGETVDPDGTRRGFYSYPGADGKMITVKYTAGKNGFQAEGDHLPRQPQVPAHSDQDEDYISSVQTHGGRGASQHRSQPAPVPRAHYAPAPQPQHVPAPQPIQSYARPAGPSYSSQSNPGHYSSHGGNGVQYSTGASPSSGGGRFRGPSNFQDFGPSFGQAPQYSSNVASHTPRASNSGAFSAHNPYQQAGPAGPYTGNFDLGNGGQFTIDFNPGQAQQVRAGGDHSGLQSQRF